MNFNRSGAARSACIRSCHLAAMAAGWLGVALSASRADPLNPLDFYVPGGVGSLPTATYTVNTSANPPTLIGPGVNLVGSVLTGTTSSGVAVFAFDGLSIYGTVNVTGTRAVAFLSKSTLFWQATLNANGGAGGAPNGTIGGAGGTPGPGGFAGGAGGAATGGGEWGRGAGGGGSSGVVPSNGGGGGFGGAAATTPSFGGGAVNGVQPNYLLGGGSGGGGGSGSVSGGGFGGGGGGGVVELGAIQTLSVSGVINVSGGAGGGGESFGAAGRGGGGSGGSVLLHGQIVNISLPVNALGGAGGNALGNSTVGGGGGGGGRVHIQCPSVVGGGGSVNVQGGLNGGPPGNGGSAGVSTTSRPQLTVYPVLLNFGSVALNTSKTISVYAQNTGDAGTVIYGRFAGVSYPFHGEGNPAIHGLRPGMVVRFDYVFDAVQGYFDFFQLMQTNGGAMNLRFVGVGVLPPATACNPADIATVGSPDPFSGADGFLTGEDFDAFIILFFQGC